MSQEGGAQPLASLDKNYIDLVNGWTFGMPNLVWFFLICAVVMWIVWNKTTLGKNMFAIGGRNNKGVLMQLCYTEAIYQTKYHADHNRKQQRHPQKGVTLHGRKKEVV